jgi:hypothetical protein
MKLIGVGVAKAVLCTIGILFPIWWLVWILTDWNYYHFLIEILQS